MSNFILLLFIFTLEILKIIWYQKLIIINFDNLRIVENGKLGLQQLKYPASIPPISPVPRPI